MNILDRYLKFWRISEPVFNRNLPAGICYLSGLQEKLRHHLLILAQQVHTVQLITAPGGLGKSTVLRWLQQQIPPGRTECFQITLLKNEKNAGWLLPPLARFLSGSGQGASEPWSGIARGLDQLHQEGKMLLILIDSGEYFSGPDSFQDLGFLHNAGVLAGCGVSLIVAGPESLACQLASSGTLAGKISLHWQMQAFDREETARYLFWYFRQSGLAEETFSGDAVTEIFSCCHGIPSRINSLAEHCLIGAASQNMRNIGPDLVRAVSELTFCLPHNHPSGTELGPGDGSPQARGHFFGPKETEDSAEKGPGSAEAGISLFDDP